MTVMPKTLGGCADRLYRVVRKRKEAQKVVDKLRTEQREIEEHIKNELPKSRLTGVAGKLCRVKIKQSNIPAVKDWTSLYKYIAKTGQFDLLQKRVAVTAIRERWDAEVSVPGVEVFIKTDVTILKN